MTGEKYITEAESPTPTPANVECQLLGLPLKEPTQ